MPNIPYGDTPWRKAHPGTPFKATHTIREGSRGMSDPAAENWDRVFPKKTCGVCVNFSACGISGGKKGGGTCGCGRRGAVAANEDACVAKFERRA